MDDLGLEYGGTKVKCDVVCIRTKEIGEVDGT